MKKMIQVLMVLSSLVLSKAALASEDPAVVSNVDFSRYIGLWYEIGHSPNFFQRWCERSTAEYGVNEKGNITVFNTCLKNNKVHSTISGEAKVVNPDVPAKLRVDFGWFRRGDYWIVSLDENYQWAVVSGPKKSSLFILSRQAPMHPELLKNILADLNQRGFNTEEIVYDTY